MTTLLLDVGHRLLSAPLPAVAADVLDLLVAQPSVAGAELVQDGHTVARSGKPGAAVVLPLDTGELRITYRGTPPAEDQQCHAVVATLLSLAARTEAVLAAERRALADGLHDGLLQTLVAARLMPGRDLVGEAILEARELMRSLRDRPPAQRGEAA